jgi:SAM-dependent methyltransferase
VSDDTLRAPTITGPGTAFTNTIPSDELRVRFGGIDIYLFDQLLRGRFDNRPHILDAGCGDGRNLVYFLRAGFSCFGVDSEPAAIARLRHVASRLAPDLPATNFVVGQLDRLDHADASMDAVVCSAVLHFAEDEAHFGRMVEELWRVLGPKGLFFSRLASNIGLESVIPSAGRRVRLPDGSERFVVSEAMLLQWTERLGGSLADPIKTTNVQGLRCMTTWCVFRD